MSNIKEVFLNKELSKEKVIELHKFEYEEILKCEKETVSTYSPGVISDEEVLARNIYSEHDLIVIDGIKSISETVFSDVVDKGFSIIRMSIANHEEVIGIGYNKLSMDIKSGKVGRGYLGYITAEANQIRNFFYEIKENSIVTSNDNSEKRVFSIFDTADENLKYHGEICSLILNPTKVQRQFIRKKLQEKFTSYDKIISPPKK